MDPQLARSKDMSGVSVADAGAKKKDTVDFERLYRSGRDDVNRARAG